LISKAARGGLVDRDNEAVTAEMDGLVGLACRVRLIAGLEGRTVVREAMEGMAERGGQVGEAETEVF
jgi:hypothetical protein